MTWFMYENCCSITAFFLIQGFFLVWFEHACFEQFVSRSVQKPDEIDHYVSNVMWPDLNMVGNWILGRQKLKMSCSIYVLTKTHNVGDLYNNNTRCFIPVDGFGRAIARWNCIDLKIIMSWEIFASRTAAPAGRKNMIFYPSIECAKKQSDGRKTGLRYW